MTARPKLVLAIYFQTPGFAFVLLQEQLNPIDWGSREITGLDRAKRCLKHVDSRDAAARAAVKSAMAIDDR